MVVALLVSVDGGGGGKSIYSRRQLLTISSPKNVPNCSTFCNCDGIREFIEFDLSLMQLLTLLVLFGVDDGLILLLTLLLLLLMLLFILLFLLLLILSLFIVLLIDVAGDDEEDFELICCNCCCSGVATAAGIDPVIQRVVCFWFLYEYRYLSIDE